MTRENQDKIPKSTGSIVASSILPPDHPKSLSTFINVEPPSFTSSMYINMTLPGSTMEVEKPPRTIKEKGHQSGAIHGHTIHLCR